MSILYCSECGYKNEYTLHPPNFCGGCGEKIELGGKGSPAKKKTRETRGGELQKPSFAKKLDDDETDIDFVPNLKKLDIDVSYESEGNRTFKGEDIVNAPKEDLSNRPSR